MAVVRHKEAIHSGHFMVSEFEAEAQVKMTFYCLPVIYKITAFRFKNNQYFLHLQIIDYANS